MSPQEFADLCPIEFYWAMIDFNELEQQRIQTQFSVARFQAWMDFRNNGFISQAERTRKDTPEKLVQFAWESKTGKRPLKNQSWEDHKKILMEMAKRSKKPGEVSMNKPRK